MNVIDGRAGKTMKILVLGAGVVGTTSAWFLAKAAHEVTVVDQLGSNDTQLNPVRCAAIVRRTLDLFPGIARPEKAEFWAGLRPSTPSNVPYIGKTKFRNLYLNTGHGTLGWTPACGSAHAIAEIASGRDPGIDFAFCGVG